MKKAPLKSPKNFWATGDGMFGERTQSSASAYSPHRKVPARRSGVCTQSSATAYSPHRKVPARRDYSVSRSAMIP